MFFSSQPIYKFEFSYQADEYLQMRRNSNTRRLHDKDRPRYPLRIFIYLMFLPLFAYAEIYRRVLLPYLLSDNVALPGTKDVAIIAGPPVFVALGFYRLFITYRAKAIDREYAGRLAKRKMSVDIYPEGLILRSEGIESRVEWLEIKRILAEKQGLEFVMTTSSIYVPRRAFPVPGTYAAVAKEIISLWKEAVAMVERKQTTTHTA